MAFFGSNFFIPPMNLAFFIEFLVGSLNNRCNWMLSKIAEIEFPLPVSINLFLVTVQSQTKRFFRADGFVKPLGILRLQGISIDNDKAVQ